MWTKNKQYEWSHVFHNGLHFKWIQCDKKTCESIGGALWMCSAEVCVWQHFIVFFETVCTLTDLDIISYFYNLQRAYNRQVSQNRYKKSVFQSTALIFLLIDSFWFQKLNFSKICSNIGKYGRNIRPIEFWSCRTL